MNLKEMIEFDTLRYKHPRTVPEEVRYQELLERVILGADGKSEFDTSLTEAEKKMNEEMQKELCSRLAIRFFKDLALYGPKIASNTIDIIVNVLRTTGKL